jgi:hypothetical protein
MSNWITIAAPDLAGAKIGAIMTTAIANGFDQAEAIADVTARIRSAVSAGNALDIDPTTIPKSLKGMAVRMIIALAKAHIEYAMTADEKTLQTDDSSYLRRIIDEDLKFEAPDNPAGSAEMQSPAPIEFQSHRPQANYKNLQGLT